MPLYPGASQGCDECRRRRKKSDTLGLCINAENNKCDLNKPECLRCCKAGIKCSGLKDSRTFINRNAANLTQQTDKNALVYALQNRRKSKSTAADFEGPSSSDDSQSRRTTLAATEPSLPSDIISIDFPGRLTFLALIEDFKPVSPGGIFSGDRISRDDPIYSSAALCIRALLPLTSLRIGSLNLSIFSLLTTYMGNLKSDIKLAQLAQSSYTSALKKSRLHIQKVMGNSQPGAQPKANLELILLLAIAFLAFEFVNENEYSEAALLAHIGGVLSILELYGPCNFSSPQMRQAFSGFRGIFLSVGLSKHIPTFLSDSDWIRLPFLNIRKTRTERLHDIALQIPWLFYQTDRWFNGLENYASNDSNRRETSDSPKQNLETALSLLNDYWAVFDQMEEWQNNWKASEQGPLYWHSDIPMPSKVIDVDTVCIPSFPDETYQVRFQNTQKAGLAVTFWSFRLELLMGMIKLQRSLLSTQVESLEQNLAMAEETASLILQTAPYLTCCFEGAVASKASLRTITRYFELGDLEQDFDSLSTSIRA
ncbi:Zn(II)2Cys6 transcription factor domain-containing protein [Aspergillus alliaceus]|uniref:Zn(II)2Cys6 transcription factor domain-containing protein n=1 Tax=Petromyces alliaceus TaxID=209559 RepID=UPI0012A3E437|nr:uncharacterized protein BDW43DRAFT_314761 [Aspergillus alliaceus]KAB8229561.1 hypothetical protein BDW43DRAFT_314761 [Aspergillus alliaceus]